ncbi:LytR/AlgR family response regulator transcription factor [Paenibacillus pabuli]|uniref:LytR/AlgR family response regulator transcription factor n=1 Tax=Paenibacillus pabuli TaxID=1472 RepID=UPI0020004711|nr:LytTR family DNA-binding domain-containing protein [Paenibacillus pabuli]UPK41104.1 response regulator transcription factor [Paenibacillus pabuli]
METNLKVLIVDDEQVCLDTLRASLDVFNDVRIVGEATNALEAIRCLQNHNVDLVFLDIKMGDTNGFELAEHIQSMYPEILLIFLTGNVEFALTGYDFSPIDFLVKPVHVIRLEKALSKVRSVRRREKEKAITQIGIHVDGGMEIITVDNITFIEKVGRKVLIHFDNGKVIHTSDSLQKLESVFSEFDFFRSHQSFLIPLDKIEGIYIDDFKRSYNLKLKNAKDVLPLSRDKHIELKRYLSQKGIQFH